MTTKIRIALCAALVAVPAWVALRGAEPAPPGTTGRVLLLRNERALEGDVRREGEEYRVRRAIGEVAVPAAAVLKLCAGWEDVYQFLRSQANLRDPDEHLRLARWCRLNGL